MSAANKSSAIWIFAAIVVAAVVAPVVYTMANRAAVKVDQAAYEADLEEQLGKFEAAMDKIGK